MTTNPHDSIFSPIQTPSALDIFLISYYNLYYNDNYWKNKMIRTKIHKNTREGKNTLFKPKHVQVMEHIEHKLLNGEYPLGERLPTTKEMSKEYQVGDNVITKAIKLLVEKGLLEAKVGSGIYSIVKEQKKQPISDHVEPDKCLSFWPGKKRLTVWIEDFLPHQQLFWQSVFDKFKEISIDIEPELYFGREAYDLKKFPDMILGGVSYLNNSQYGIEDLLDDNIINEFYPDLYNHHIINPDFLTWAGQKALFPFGFTCPFFICLDDFWQEEYNQCSSYLELLGKTSNKNTPPRIFDIWNITNALAVEGCKWLDQQEGRFSFQNSNHWLEILKILNELFRKKKISWTLAPHRYNTKAEIVSDLHNKVLFKEIGMPNLYQFTEERHIKSFPVPFHDTLPITTINAMILRHTMYPEECLQVLTYILREDIQHEYLNSGLGFCINEDAFINSEYKEYLPRFKKLKNVFLYPPEKLLHVAINEVFIWELYHYLHGRDNNNILERIIKKFNYFLDNISRMEPEILLNDSSKKLLSKYLLLRKKENTMPEKLKTLMPVGI